MVDEIKNIIELNKKWIREHQKRIKFLKWYNPLYWLLSYPNEKKILRGYIKTYKEFMRIGVKIMTDRRNKQLTKDK
jgi:hypothetical protein